MEVSKIMMKTYDYVLQLFQKNEKKELVYHNYRHTSYVVEKCMEIGAHYSISDKEALLLFVAAWFHDTGYLFTDPELHEEKSVELMQNFAKKIHLDKSDVQQIEQCILSTKSPRNPQKLIDKILCDADTFNIGTKAFAVTNKMVMKEMQLLKNFKGTKEQYDEGTIKFLKKHTYYTQYCKQMLNKGKNHNLKMVMTNLKGQS